MNNLRLNTNNLKYIAITAMLIDHFAWTFLETATPAAMIMHFIGRTTAPIMCFFIAQGYELTSNKTKYAIRLGAFALISQIPWMIYHDYGWYSFSWNMIFTLFVCFCAVHVESTMKNKFFKAVIIMMLCLVTLYSDWMIFAVLYSVFFYRHKNNPKMRLISFSCISAAYFMLTFTQTNIAYDNLSTSFILSLYTLGTFIAYFLISRYDKNLPFTRKSKWIFYIFYPAHILFLGIAENLINRGVFF